MTTTTATEYPGLEAKAQKIFDMPYSELALHFQKAVRSLVAKDAAEEMLEALKDMVTIAQQDDWHNALTGRQVSLDAAEKAIKKASGQ